MRKSSLTWLLAVFGWAVFAQQPAVIRVVKPKPVSVLLKLETVKAPPKGATSVPHFGDNCMAELRDSIEAHLQLPGEYESQLETDSLMFKIVVDLNKNEAGDIIPMRGTSSKEVNQSVLEILRQTRKKWHTHTRIMATSIYRLKVYITKFYAPPIPQFVDQPPGVIQPPTDRVSVPFVEIAADASKGFFFRDETIKFIFPKDIFVDQQGNTVRGMINIRFRDLTYPLARAFSGIPFYDSPIGNDQLWQTRLAHEIYATKDGKPISIAQGKSYKIVFPLFYGKDSTYIARLNTETPAWEYTVLTDWMQYDSVRKLGNMVSNGGGVLRERRLPRSRFGHFFKNLFASKANRRSWRSIMALRAEQDTAGTGISANIITGQFERFEFELRDTQEVNIGELGIWQLAGLQKAPDRSQRVKFEDDNHFPLIFKEVMVLQIDRYAAYFYRYGPEELDKIHFHTGRKTLVMGFSADGRMYHNLRDELESLPMNGRKEAVIRMQEKATDNIRWDNFGRELTDDYTFGKQSPGE